MTYQFDRSALRIGQISVIVVLALGFVLDIEAFIYFGAYLLGAALVAPRYAPQLWAYRFLVRQGLVRTEIHDEDPTPHRFAQKMGFGVLVIGVASSVLGLSAVAWGAALMVVTLALINVTTGFCAGCFVHAQLARLRS
ncbi:MAG: DUF4395 domain-containing protein [Chloroflexi bacterium]|nr:DUF4395 domain-containing protein [Chloroflexota bacterium]